ncbi:MAG TPA: sulfotransferase [Gammaproteobacteria bacterium]|nr:sulfotransferase [Gammaproteobacteria bacterium]
MRLPTPFIQLPLSFDAARLQAEIGQFAPSDWRVHPQGFAGNSALILVSRDGGENDDLAGEMRPSPRLERCPYLRQVLASFHTVIGRSRLMRLAPGAEVTAHTDIDYYWRERIRIHVPVVTDPQVRFQCGGSEIHMRAGDAWIFDNWRPHRVINPSGITRIHLVVDTVGSAEFWRMVSARPTLPDRLATTRIEFQPEQRAEFALERFNREPVAHPAVVRGMTQELIADLRSQPARLPVQMQVEQTLMDLANQWQALWAVHGPNKSGHAHYALLLERSLTNVAPAASDLRMPSNGAHLTQVLQRFLPPLFPGFQEFLASLTVPRFERPLIILAAPRSGSTLLFELLARHPDLWTLPDESHAQFENIPGLAPRERSYESNRLEAADATPEVAAQLLRNLSWQLGNSRGQNFAELPEAQRPAAVRILEKTPKNALRINFLQAIFPDAQFLFLHRDPAASLGSMLDAWHSGKFITYPQLPGWSGPPWSLLLTPNWRTLAGQPLAQVVAQQWRAANEAILAALAHLPRERWRALNYAELLRDPAGVFTRAGAFMQLAVPQELLRSLPARLPYSSHTLTPPAKDKWRRRAEELEPVLPALADLNARLQRLDNRL